MAEWSGPAAHDENSVNGVVLLHREVTAPWLRCTTDGAGA